VSADSGGTTREAAQRFYVHGLEAARKGHFDYAIQLLREACRASPESLMFRRALRAAQRQRLGNRPPGRLAAVGTLAAKAKLRTQLARGNLAKALEACEDVLTANPWDVAALTQEASILDQLGHLDAAIWNAEIAAQTDPNDWAANRLLATLYEKRGEYSRAIACWERVRRIRPEDKEAAARIKDLAAAETIQRGGYDDAEHIEDVLVETPEAQAKSSAGAARGQDRLEALRERVESDPTDLQAHLELSHLLRARRRWDEAAKLMQRALHASGGHPDAQTELAEIELDRLRFDLEMARVALQRQPNDPTLQRRAAEAEQRLNEYELREYRRRVERYPRDAKLRCELAIRLARAKLYDEAITQLQQVRSDPRQRFAALMWLGHCFFAKRIFRLAERHYRDALELLTTSGQASDEHLKELHYLLGRTYEELADREQAQRHYEEAAAIDYGYRDVATRLQQLST